MGAGHVQRLLEVPGSSPDQAVAPIARELLGHPATGRPATGGCGVPGTHRRRRDAVPSGPCAPVQCRRLPAEDEVGQGAITQSPEARQPTSTTPRRQPGHGES